MIVKCTQCGCSGIHACMGKPYHLLPKEERDRLAEHGIVPLNSSSPEALANLIKVLREREAG